MKKIITLVFAAVLSLAVVNVMASDKNDKKSKSSKKVKVNKTMVVKEVNLNTAENAKKRSIKAITLDDLKKIKLKTAVK